MRDKIRYDFGKEFILSDESFNVTEKDIDVYKKGNIVLEEECTFIVSCFVRIYTGGEYKKVVVLKKDIPIFDSGDCAYDSWHDLFFVQKDDGSFFVVFCGHGYCFGEAEGYERLIGYPEGMKKYIDF